MINFGSDQVVYTNCVFKTILPDSMERIYVLDVISNTAHNCSFIDNEAATKGGGIYVANHGFFLISNCTFSGNMVLREGWWALRLWLL